MRLIQLVLLVANLSILVYLLRASRILGTKISKVGSKTITQAQLSRELARTQQINFQLLESYIQLLKLLDLKAPLPRTRSYASSPDLLLELCSIIGKIRPSTTVELGSGISTVVIGNQIGPDAHLFSIDHSEEFASSTIKLLNEHNLSNVTMIVAPLDSQTNWYTTKYFSDLKEIDLLFIDGPPQSVGVDSRHPATYFLDRLSANAIVVIDDSKRDSEARLAHKFAELMPSHTLTFLDHEKGTAVIKPKNQ